MDNMVKVSAFLKMLDQLNRKLQIVTDKTNGATNAMDKLRKAVQTPAKLKIDTSGVQNQLTVLRKMTQAVKVKIRVSFNFLGAIAKAFILRRMLQKQLDGIKVKLQVELPASLNAMFANLQRLVLKFIAATKRLNGVGGKLGQQTMQPKQKNLQPHNLASQNSAQKQICKCPQMNQQPPQNQTKDKTESFGSKLSKSIGTVFNSIKSAVPNLKSGMDYADNYMNARTRIELINDGSQSTDELQNKIFAASQRSRGSFTDMAAVVGRMGMTAGDSFSSNDELIAFSELMQKSFRLGGAGDKEKQAGVTQLSQAMGAGKLQGAEFKSIIENAPVIAEAIANFTGKSMGELKEMAASGTISADVIKGAMFAAAKDINSKFEDMPRTFADIGVMFDNFVLKAAGPSIEKLSQLLKEAFESGKLDAIFTPISNGIALVASIAAWAGQLIVDNMDLVRNILVAVGLVALGVGAYFLFSWLMAAWPILLIIGLIVGIIAILNSFGISTADIIGYVAGLFMYLVAAIWNAIAVIWNIIVSFVEFLANVFIDPAYAWEKLWYDMKKVFLDVLYNLLLSTEDFAGGFMTTILKAVNFVIEKINSFSKKIADWTGINLGQMQLLDENNIHAMSDKIKAIRDQLEEPVSSKNVVDFSGAKMDQLNYKDMFDKGFGAGKGLFDSAGDAFGKFGDFAVPPFNNKAPSNMTPNIDKVGEVGKIQETVEVSSEDLKIMRELAEMKNIQNYVTLQPSINFGDTHVRNEGDLNSIVAKITQKLEQDIAVSADAAYG